MEGDDRELIERSLDGLDDVFYVYDCEGRLVHWNQQLNDRFSLTDGELAGMRPEEFFLPDDRDLVRAAVGEVFETGETVVEARAETTGGVVVFQLTGRLVAADDGTPLGFCGVGRDVTDRRERERLLAGQNERLEAFADIVAHDIRNPLAVAMGHLEFERDARDSDHLRSVAVALDRIDRIVDDVLAVARDGEAVTDPEPVSLAAVARDAWETVATENATLDVTTSLTVAADEARLRRLLENLFRNAVEHGSTGSRPAADDSVEHGSTSNRTEPGDSVEHGSTSNRAEPGDSVEHGSTSNRAEPGDSVEHGSTAGQGAVSVTVEDAPEGFAVADDGPGVPPGDRDRVFAPGVSRSVDGTGFGLHIVETLAAAHGWTVRVEDGAGGGARFVFDVGGPVEADASHRPVRQPEDAAALRGDDPTGASRDPE